MIPIETSFTKLFGISTPIVASPMAGASGGELAAQVTLGGGFGFLSSDYLFDTPESLRKEIAVARKLVDKENQNINRPIGVGFLCWQLETSPVNAEQLLSVTLESNVQAIWFSFGSDIGRWVKYVREHDNRAGSPHAVKIFIQISSVEQASLAFTEWKADVVVVQGNEAGGHGYGKSLPLLTLFPIISQSTCNPNGAPVLAAGGIANGSQIASLLTLGASGVVLGTRFLLSPESLYSDAQRYALIKADSSKSTRTMAFDKVRNTLGWPLGVDGRGLRNATVDEYEKGEDINVLKQKFAEGMRTSDTCRIIVWAGSGVGLMKKIMPARDIVSELHDDCLERLKAANDLYNIKYIL